MMRLVEGGGIKEIIPIKHPVKHQTPLTCGCCGILEEVVQQDLWFIVNEVDVKKGWTDIIEFQTLALVQSPVDTSQAKG